MEHNTGPVNAILIGSRAWNKDLDSEKSSSKSDWDLIVTAERLSDLLHGRMFYHYRSQLEQGKLSVVSQTGAKVEFEIMEKFESAKVLKALSKEQKKTIKLQNLSVQIYTGQATVARVWAAEANIPTKEALLVLKASHIYFPINWRKNFLQLVSMMSSFSKSFSKVIKEDPHSSLLKELFQTRARETLHRVKSQVHLSVQRIHAPTINQLRDLCKGCYDREEFIFADILQLKEDPSDTFYLPTTGLKLSKSAWSKYGVDVTAHKSGEVAGKALIVHEQLVLLALHYYLPQHRSFGFLSKLKKEDQINELFMLCVETFVTQQLVPVTRTTDHHPEYKSCLPVDGAGIAPDVFIIDLYETLPLATNAELSKTTFANPIVNWLLDNLSTEYDTIRQSFAAFVQSCIETHKDLFTYKQFTIHLPFEIIDMIESSVPNDHVLLSKLCRVCKSWNKYFSEDAKWEALCDRFDEQTKQLARENISSHQRCTWKLVFKNALELMQTTHNMQYCRHCRKLHPRVFSYDERNSKTDEAYWSLCVCPLCDAGSWRECPYYQDFFYA